LHFLKILRGVLTVHQSMVGMKCVSNRFAGAIANHFAERHEWDTALPPEHHGMIERRKSNAASDGVINDILP
jgi:hypothetical protein